MSLSPVSSRIASATFIALPVLAFASPGWAQINNYGLLTGQNAVPGAAVEFDTRTNAPIGSVPVGNAPQNAVFSPDGRFAYTANLSGNSVSVIDVLSRSIVATIPVAGGPASLTLSPNGQFLYTANQFNGTVSVINTATNAVTGPPITVGATPIGVAASPDGNTLYVTNFGSNTVSVVDAATKAVTATIPVGVSPFGVTVSPDGTKLYVVNESGTLSVINTSTNTIVATVPVGATPLSVAASPDGTRVVVTNQFNTVFVIDAATNTVLTTVNVNSQAAGAAYTPDGSRLYVSRTNGADIINPATNTVVGTVSAPGLGVGNIGTSFIGPNIIEAAGGPLSVASDAALTPLGFGQFVNFNGGTLQAGASFSTARTLSLLAGGGTIDTNGFSVTVSGQIINTGGLTKAGLGTLVLSGANTYTGGTTLNAGTVSVSADNNLGAASGGLTFNGGTLQTTSTFVSNRAVTLNAAGGTFNTDTSTGLELAGVISGTGGLTKTGGGILLLSGINTYTGGTTINGGSLQLGSTLATARIVGSVTNNAALAVANADLSGVTSITNNLSMGFFGTSSASSILLTTNAGATTSFREGSTGGNATLVTNAGGTVDISPLTSTGTTAGSIAGAGLYNLGSKQLTVGSNNLSTTVSGVIADGGLGGGTGGSLVKVGSGTLALGGANTYSGGTTVNGGLVNFAAANNFGRGAIALNGGGLQWAAGTTTDISPQLAPLGTGGGTFDTNGNNVTLATGLGGAGGLIKQGAGLLNLAGNSTYAGPTTVNAGVLSVNGSLASSVTVNSGGMIGGNGTVAGLVSNGGTFAPGNSIGTLTVNGNLVQNGGTYQVEANAAGQSDRINVSGTAAINGGAVQVLAQPGVYAANTTYTILSAGGGVAGAYSSVTSNFAFLTPSLAYTTNDVLLTLSLAQNAFSSFGGNTPNQRAVGAALDQSFPTSTGDFNAVLNAIAVLNTTQGPAALTAISGQPWADFGTMNINNAALFMNALGQQMANARGGGGAGQRQALAQACEIESCDGASPLSVWASALGGLGSVLGDSNASTLTYNLGGAAAGIDYRLDPRFVVGIGTGYTHGTQWVNSFMGQGWSDSVSVAAYGSFTQAGFYADALAGYAYSNNQLQRQILISGLQQRTATGSTGANQFLGQAEGGYKVGVYAPAMASITPFGRLQISSVTQNAFSESGAQSLSLNVAQQTTNSLRTTIGADLGSSIGLGNENKLDLAVRLGWQHEFADTGRPITAAFAGAPGNSFTVFGATPARDSAVVGFQATTSIAVATQAYLRYDGGVGGGTDNHALNVGVRMSF